MNELQRTQRISIAVLVIAVLLIVGLMVKEKPKIVYSTTAPEMVTLLGDYEHITPRMAQNIYNDTDNYVFVDLRSPYDYEVKHIDHAVNIPLAFLLDDDNLTLLKSFVDGEKTIVLYGQTEREAVSPWILLYEIGMTNTKILLGGFDCFTGNAGNCFAEVARYDYAKISTQGGVKEVEVPEEKPVVKKTPKKVIPVKKKEKMEAEGGC